MSVFAIFNKPKPFDLEATLNAWPDAPRFLGKKKKDMPVAAWLDQVKAGCVERKIPEDKWVDVAQALMGEKARLRLDEFQRVLVNMKGSEYNWNWKRFHLAMSSMGWEISRKKTTFFTVAARRCGLWWIVGKKGESPQDLSASADADASSKAPIKNSVTPSPLAVSIAKGTIKTKSQDDDWVSVPSAKAVAKEDGVVAVVTMPPRKKPIRAMSDSFVAAMRNSHETKPSSDEKAVAIPKPPKPQRAQTEPITTTVANAPVWLVNASAALEFLTAEYPKACSTLSAILLAAGTIPAIAASGGAAMPLLAPAVHALTVAGGGGVVAALGSHTAFAMGAVATGLGSWLKSQQDGKVTTTVAAPSAGS